MESEYEEDIKKSHELYRDYLKELIDVYKSMVRDCKDRIKNRLPLEETFTRLEEKKATLEQIGAEYFYKISQERNKLMNRFLQDKKPLVDVMKRLLGC